MVVADAEKSLAAPKAGDLPNLIFGKVQLMTLFVTRQLSYLGTTFQHFKFPQTLKAMEEKRVDPELAISEIRPLDDFFECMDMVLYDPETVKIVLEPNGSSEGM